MKKPNITEGEWKVVDRNTHAQFIAQLGTKTIVSNGNPDETEDADAKAISQVPKMIEDIMCMYYGFLGQWESVKDHPSSNYGRDAFSLYETLVNAGCEPEQKEVERFKKAGYLE